MQPGPHLLTLAQRLGNIDGAQALAGVDQGNQAWAHACAPGGEMFAEHRGMHFLDELPEF